MDSNPQNAERNNGSKILQLAVWFGLVAGMVEGLGLFLFQELGWTGWKMSRVPIRIQIIWISTAFDLFLFILLGILLVAARQLTPRLPWLRISVFLFGFMTFFDWLALTGRLRHFGVFFLALGVAVTLARWYKKHELHALQFCSRSLPGVAALALLALIGVQGGTWLKERMAMARLPMARPGMPNILVIVMDTLRADHLSSYGYNRPTSPNIDRVALGGVLFENAFSTSSWSLPSHASLLTGLYPHEHGAEINYFNGLSPTLAEALRERGFRTAAFSANQTWFTVSRGFGPGFLHFEDFFNSLADMAARTLYGRKIEQFVLVPLGYEDYPGRKRAEEVTQETLRWIGRDARRPFFAFLNYFDLHDPYLPPQPYRSKFSKIRNPGGIINTMRLRYYPTLTPEQLQDEMDAYDGAIAYVDAEIGRLLSGLEERGLAANTLVVITSDHGESFGEHGLLTHVNSLYREVIQVPLIFYWPGHTPQGLRLSQSVGNVSLPTTLMELIGAGDQTTFPAPSLVQLWTSPDHHPAWPDLLAELSQFHYEEVKKNPAYYGAMKSLLNPQWHYIQHEKFGPALYDWRQDPAETQDLAHTPEGQPIAGELATRLRSLLSRSTVADFK